MEFFRRFHGSTWWIAAVALAALAAHAWTYLPFLSDDALISMRYSARLLAGKGLTWNDGEQVEGYSNLLWVLATAALGALGLDLVDAVRVLGLMGMGAVVLAVLVSQPIRTGWGAAALAVPALLVASAGPIAAWAVGGLEQPLVAGLLAWALVLCYPLLEPGRAKAMAWLAPGSVLGLLVLTRPDGALFTAVIATALVLIRGLSRMSVGLALQLAAIPAACYLGQLAFRLAYYGDWVPNTARVKLAFTWMRVKIGLMYELASVPHFWPLVVMAAALVLGLVLARRPLGRVALLLAVGAAWSAYVAVVGGDIFPARRHMVPHLVVLVLLVAEGVRLMEQMRPHARLALLAGLWLGLGTFAGVQTRDPENRRAAAETWEWDGMVIGRLFKQAFGAERPLMAVSAAGCLPYWSELPTLDMLGLNDAYLTRNPPKDFGTGFLGHELGDGAYALRRSPDLVIFSFPRGVKEPFFRGEKELYQLPEFRRRYALVTVEGHDAGVPAPAYPTVQALVYFDRESPRIGIRRDDRRIDVPAYLFNGNPKTVAALDAAGRLAVTVSGDRPARLDALEVPAGTWRVATEPPEAARWVRVSEAPSGASLAEAGSPLRLAGSRVVKLELAPAGAGVAVRKVTLERP